MTIWLMFTYFVVYEVMMLTVGMAYFKVSDNSDMRSKFYTIFIPCILYALLLFPIVMLLVALAPIIAIFI